MNQLPSPDSGAETTQDALLIPQQQSRGSTGAAPTETTADTEAGCAGNPDELARENDRQQRELEARTIKTLRNAGAKVVGFFKDHTED